MPPPKLIKRTSPKSPVTGPTPVRPKPAEGSDSVRINKFFTQQGLCSRREADRLVEEGRITINGRVAKLGDQVGPGDAVVKDGKAVAWGNLPIYLKFHKPLGVTTTTELDVSDNIIAYIGHPARIFPVGRLDKDSTGLILLTNDGDIVNRILRAEHGHEKEYLVLLDRPFDQAFLDRMARGVVIVGKPTRPCTVARLGPRKFRIILTEGRNRQIRRMCQTLGYRVAALQRVRVMGITLENLAVGQWKNLSERELAGLFEALGKTVKR
jgi:23S rRNA pseudouridine2604 synthase